MDSVSGSEDTILLDNCVNNDIIKPDVKRRGRKRKEEVLSVSSMKDKENIKISLSSDIVDIIDNSQQNDN